MTFQISGWCPYCSTSQSVKLKPEDERSPHKLEVHYLPGSEIVCQGSGDEPGQRYALCNACQTTVPAVIELAGDAAWREMIKDWHPYEEWIFATILDGHTVCNDPELPICEGSGERGTLSHGIRAVRLQPA